MGLNCGRTVSRFFSRCARGQRQQFLLLRTRRYRPRRRAGKSRDELAPLMCGWSRLARDNLACSIEVACSHVWTAFGCSPTRLLA